MIFEKLELGLDYKALGLDVSGSFRPVLDCYVPDCVRVPAAARPAVIICPGGGYAFTSDREGEPVALSFLDKGFCCFVLWYSVTSEDGKCVSRFPASLFELASAVALVRRRAESWLVDPARIFVCGFSAGGHLAASLGTLWNRDFLKSGLGFSRREHRPDGMILGYPVITASGPLTHAGSFLRLLGGRFGDPEAAALVSLEKQVTADTVPAFIWHTADDTTVPVSNSLDFASALASCGVPFELHVFPKGRHGLARGDDSTSYEGGGISPVCAEWMSLAARWAKEFPV